MTLEKSLFAVTIYKEQTLGKKKRLKNTQDIGIMCLD